MVLVCAFYAVTRLPTNIYVIVLVVDPDVTLVDGRFYASVFLIFVYISTNPFIYTTKFDPVRQVLRGMILCKNSLQPIDGGSASSGTGNRATRVSRRNEIEMKTVERQK